MASDWYLISSQPTYNSGFEKDEFNDYVSDGLAELLGEYSPISSSVSILNSDLSTISTFRAVVQNNTSDNEDQSTKRQIITTIGTLNCGDYILYDSNVYLIVSFVGNNKIYEKAIMQLTNYTLRFQSPTGTILSYPCITSTTSFGNDESKQITLPSNQKSILLPYDEHTTLLNTGRRLYVDRLNNTTYKIIGAVDNTKFNYGGKGLIYFEVEQDLEQNNTEYPDRPDLGVCNYFEPTTSPTPPTGETYSTISASGELIIGGSFITLTPTLFNADGTINSDVTPVWDIVLPSNYISDYTIEYVDNKCKIKVAENYELIGEKVVVNVSDDNGGFVGELSVEIGSGWY